MIISRVENGGVITGLYDSSNILSSEYDKINKKLTITFGYGGRYDYLDVSLTDFTRFETADSQGKVLNSHIKAKYSFDKLGNGDVKLIKESIKEAYSSEISEFRESVINQMKQIILLGDTNKSQRLDKTILKKLVKTIEIYNNKIDKLK